MTKTKKILSVVLAFSLIFSIFLFDASAALSPEKTMGVVLTTDKTEIKQGDTVTVTLHIEFSDYNTLIGGLRLALLYDSSVYTPDAKSAEYLNDFANYYNLNKVPAVNANFLTAVLADSTLTAEEKTTCTGALMNQFQVLSSANGGITEAMGYKLTKDASADYSVPEWKVTFKVTGDPAAGSTKIFICDGMSTKSQYLKTTNGTKAVSLTRDQVDFTNAFVAPSVAAAGPAVAKSKAEVKMTPNSATTVEDAFSFRVTSVITDADWDAYFANSADSAATTNAIKSVGFVAYKGTTGFNLDTAKAVAQGTPAAGYDVATTDYIQKVNDTSDAFFGCRLNITSAETRSDVTYVAFVQYLDASGHTAYAFYDAEQQALLNTNYNTIVSTYLAAHPYAG